ncbi:hypothetical protein WG915_02290 [Corynebacterium sp. H128]|uniref:hypothetical protein n=1 Tax=unclassified Corynebacterium TaxID=2624378 RepID=UPI0030B73574
MQQPSSTSLSGIMPLRQWLTFGLAALVLLGSTVTGGTPQPSARPREAETDSITVSINGDRYQQKALGEVVTGAFVRSGKEAYLESETASDRKPRLERLQSGDADLVLGCTGELLFYLDPALAQELSAQYQRDKEKGLDPNDGTWRDKVYQAMVGSLPNTMMATDPSNATGCNGYDGPELPQNVVPVFRETALQRRDRLTLNQISGGITTKDLDELFAGPRDDDATKERAQKLLSKLDF